MSKKSNKGAGRAAGTRLFQVHSAIQAGGYPNQPALSRKLGISADCVKRDIAHLQEMFPWKLRFDQKHNGYYYSGPALFPGTEQSSEAEVFALLVANKALEHYKGTSLHKPLVAAYKKLLGQLDTRSYLPISNMEEALSIRPFAPECMEQQVFDAVSMAAASRKTLRFHYRKCGVFEGGFRTGDPYHVAYIDNCWYAFIRDHGSARVKTFVLSRMAHVSETGETFVKDPHFSPEAILKTSFGAMEGKGDYEIVIEFDAWGADLVRARKWHASQKLADLPGGGTRLTMRLGGLEEVTRWVVSFGPHATVIRPSALVEEAAVWARGFLGHHE